MGIIINKKKIFTYIDDNRIIKLKKVLKSINLNTFINKEGNTLLLHGVLKNNKDMVTLLLESGALPDISNKILQNNNYTYPLHIAASRNYPEIVKLLLAYGANPEVKDIKDLTPLHHACKYGSYLCAGELVKGGARVDATTIFNTQPLHYAAEKGYTTIVELLLEHGAPINGIPNDEKPPLYWAMKGLWIETARVLINHGAISDFLNLSGLQKDFLCGKEPDLRNENLDEIDVFGRTILFYAIASKDSGLTERLIELGCDKELKDIFEFRAEDYSPYNQLTHF
ncbi:MAG: ankyrin repeat domain-containing protein [Spirochaetales bacterium]|nr:ankyrin repeat domain-containing protein [Spirochaetales bacterium]